MSRSGPPPTPGRGACEVLAFDLTAGGVPKLNTDWRWEDQEEAVLSACSSLVSVIADHGSRVVQFSHFSVKEFLTSGRLAGCLEEVSKFHIPVEPSHAILAQACLAVFLCLDDRSRVWEFPLYRYAAEYWARHARVGNADSQIKDALDYFFDMDNPHFLALARLKHARNLLTAAVGKKPTGVLRPAAPLYFASWIGLRCLVERLIIKDPQQVPRLGGLYGTPLHASVLGAHIEISQLLIAHGADINSRCEDHWTPLHVALDRGYLEIAKWLLNHGADVNSQNNDGWTPLHFAANLNFEACQMLLEHHAEVDSRSNDEYTPFLRAWMGGGRNPDILQLFLDYNADARVCDDEEYTPLHLAAENGLLKLSQTLLERNVAVEPQKGDGSTPLLRALQNGHPSVARLLLDHNANVHVHDGKGDTPLHYAAVIGLLEIVLILLERDADVNSQDSHGSTPLLLASEFGHRDVVQLLLDHKADLYLRDSDGDTPLHCSAIGGQLEVTQLLLKLNVEVNSRNVKGSTPLHLASTGSWRLPEGSAVVVRLLLDHGADVEARDLSGQTPSEVARGPERQEIVRLLSEHTAERTNEAECSANARLEAQRVDVSDDYPASLLLMDSYGSNRN